jgi:DnaJ-class molecular chaperone
MAEAYEILDLPQSASDAEVRRRYLELVRQFPPDRAPERFTEIHRAYEQLRDPVPRIEARLFDLRTSETMADILADVRQRLRESRIPTQTLLSLAEA